MGFEGLIGGLFLVTLLAAIGFALWSKRRTDRMHDRHEPKTASPLARETPDPDLKPDRDVTDPEHVRS